MSNDTHSELYNATHLFEKEKYHCSESFWSSVFALYIIYESRQETPKSIPVYRYLKDPKWEFREVDTLKIPRNLTVDKITVEGTLTKDSFEHNTGYSNEINGLKPDIFIMTGQDVTIIENKALMKSISQKDLYRGLISFLKANDYRPKRYLLISCGTSDKLLNTILLFEKGFKTEIQLVLWEDILKMIDESECFIKYAFGELSRYYECLPRALREENYML